MSNRDSRQAYSMSPGRIFDYRTVDHNSARMTWTRRKALSEIQKALCKAGFNDAL